MTASVQVREERATDRESVEAERMASVAVLALASQVAGGPTDASAVQNLQSMYAAPSYIPAVPSGPGNVNGPGTPSNITSIPDTGPRSFSLPVFAPKPKEDVFGPACPGLFVSGMLLQMHSVYSGARDGVLKSPTSRTAADACAAAGVLAALLVSNVV